MTRPCSAGAAPGGPGLGRRDLFTISALGAAALALPLERVVRAKAASRIAASKLPKPFSVPFAAPPALTPLRRDATTDYHELTMMARPTQILPGVSTTVWGYNGIVPGPTIEATVGRRVVMRVDFKILGRNGKPPRPEERGPRDVVYVGENEKVRVITKFEHGVGRYMIHCHGLPHEDHDMMTQFEVGEGGPDPIRAAPARALPARPL
jgi:FtsP/CotA-like multicopper oxidase with cupredoxin domain